MSEAKSMQRRCQELLPVFQAGAQGKTVQFRAGPECEWIDLEKPNGREYRVKPEPKYRPFTVEEALAHVGRRVSWTRHGGSVPHASIAGVTKRDGEFCVLYESRGYDSLSTLLEAYRFTDDGSPCGSLIPE